MATRDAPPPPPEDEPKTFDVGHDGDKIGGIYTGKDSRRTWGQDDTARLELAAQHKPEPKEIALPTREPASRSKVAIAIAVMASAFVVPLLAIEGHKAYVRWRDGDAKAQGLIMIDSVPVGSRVIIAGKDVGPTPYVAPNRVPPGESVEVRVEYPGAQEWVGTIQGGVNVTLTAELQAQPAK
jgi:hypothetical protein